MAKTQLKEQAHVIDVNVDYVGRDGEEDMEELVSRLVTNINLPLIEEKVVSYRTAHSFARRFEFNAPPDELRPRLMRASSFYSILGFSGKIFNISFDMKLF